MSNKIKKLDKNSFSAVKKELETLKNKKFEYKVLRPADQYGYVKDMSQDCLVRAFAEIKKKLDFSQEAAKELGIDPKNSNSATKYNGYTLDEWKADFLVRVDQLQTVQRIKKLTEAAGIVEDNLSDSDRHDIALDKVNELLG